MSFGTPGGEFPSVCRAAIVAAVGHHSERAEEPVPPDTCDLLVFDPQGLFFNTVPHDEDEKRGGTWHWPERTGEAATTATGLALGPLPPGSGVTAPDMPINLSAGAPATVTTTTGGR